MNSDILRSCLGRLRSNVRSKTLKLVGQAENAQSVSRPDCRGGWRVGLNFTIRAAHCHDRHTKSLAHARFSKSLASIFESPYSDFAHHREIAVLWNGHSVLKTCPESLYIRLRG